VEHAEIEKRFRHHPPRSQQDGQAHESAREAFRQLAHEMNETLPDGREKSLVLTALEEGLMWANAALARARAVPAATDVPERGRQVPQITLSEETPGS
jgi:hypothetical protein